MPLKLQTLAGIISTRLARAVNLRSLWEPVYLWRLADRLLVFRAHRDAETRTELRSQYERCLCRPCLEGFAAKENRPAS